MVEASVAEHRSCPISNINSNNPTDEMEEVAAVVAVADTAAEVIEEVLVRMAVGGNVVPVPAVDTNEEEEEEAMVDEMIGAADIIEEAKGEVGTDEGNNVVVSLPHVL